MRGVCYSQVGERGDAIMYVRLKGAVERVGVRIEGWGNISRQPADTT